MEPAVPFDWHRIFVGDEPALFYAEIAFRVVVIYVYALILIRFMGKRGSRNLSPMENLVIIALGSATGDSMFYPEVPLTYAALVVTLTVGLSRLAAEAQLRSRRANAFIDGFPLLMLRHGALVEGALERARMRRDEFDGMLRIQSIANTVEVRYALLERTGELSVFRYGDGEAVDGEDTWPPDLANGGVPGLA